jgi:hypothetical protein
LERWLDGLAMGIAAIAIVALVSRFFPGSFPGRELLTFLPDSESRLSFPLDYWNGLGILLALGVPLLLARSLADSRLASAAAVGVVPAFGAAVYLTSSRGAVAAGVVGIAAFVLASDRRWAAAGAIAVAAAGTAVSVVIVAGRDELVNGPLSSSAAHAQGRWAAVLVGVTCLATGAAYWAARAVAPRLPVPPRPVRLGAVAALAAAVVVGVIAADPIERFDEFRALPESFSTSNFVQTHFVSGSGSGRWQFWSAAVDEFSHAPLNGMGTGSYGVWWAMHGAFYYPLKDAHSLYLQTLGELGIVGLLLLLGFLAVALVPAARRIARLRGHERTLVAGFLGAALAFLVGAGLDWMWQLTAVALVGICCIAILSGPVAAMGSRELALVTMEAPRVPRRRFPILLAVTVVAWLFVCAAAIPLLSDLEVRKSQSAFRAGDAQLALNRAGEARRIQPWAATPYLQLALVQESLADYGAARRSIRGALERDDDDWRLWLVEARIAAAQGDSAASARSLARARKLNPGSPVLRQGTALP